jgi:hypothetical protein
MQLETPPPSEPRRSDLGHWAQPVERLETTPNGGLDTVRGRQTMGVIQGFGKLWQKTFRVQLVGATATPQEVIAVWKKEFPSFWPRGNTFHAPLTGIEPGEVALLAIGLPGGLKLSTGVVVIYADDESFTFMTPQGHTFAGWVTFSAFRASRTDESAPVVAQAQILMRAQNPLTEVALALGGHRQEDAFWQHTLRALAARMGAEPVEPETQVLCVDSRRQWRRIGNIRYDASIRSALYTFTAPVRWLRRH